ncbi:MAG: hypothetical protein ACYCT1_08505 [Steroidobacteraceae bacterium]
MPGTWIETVWEIVAYGGKAGVDELRDRARAKRTGAAPAGGRTVQVPQLRELVPNLRSSVPQIREAVPRIASAAPRYRNAVPTVVPEAVPAPADGPSYAEEFGGLGIAGYDDSSPVACWPCTVRHLTTIAATAQRGANGGRDPKETAIVVRGEVEVWLEYDVTPERLAATSPGRRAPIQAAARSAPALLRLLPTAPGQAALAWAAAGEAERMLRGDPSELERMQAHRRLHHVQGWIGDMDTLQLPPAAAPHLTAVRKARHQLNADEAQGIVSHAGAIQARDALWGLALATTPAPDPEDMQALAQHATAMRDRFTAAAFGLTSAPAAGPGAAKAPAGAGKLALPRVDRVPWAPGERVYEDRETRPPGRLVDMLAQGDFLGSTERSRTAFGELLALNAARGVGVRDYPLPPDIEMEHGKPVAGFVVFGAFFPRENAILLGPQVYAEAPRDVETIGEETAHALLDSDRCNVWENTRSMAYEEQPEEREAKLANTVALLQAGIPFEDDFGRQINPVAVRLDTERLERTEDPRIVRRALWAAGIMAMALSGDVAGAAAASSACPR